MSNFLKRMYEFVALALVVGCSAPPPVAVVNSVDEIAKRPIQHDGQIISVGGALILTSEGYFLVSNCEAVRELDIRRAVLIPKIDSNKAIEIGAIGAFVEVEGTFLMAETRKVNSRHRLVGLKGMRVSSNVKCNG